MQDRGRQFWQESLHDIYNHFHSGPKGLQEHQVKERLRSYGPNVIAHKAGQKPIWAFMQRFQNPLVLLLLIAALLILCVGDIQGFILITTIVIASVTIDFVQEHRANKAAEFLKKSVALYVDVWRSGTKHKILASGLVPGDVVDLEAGDLVPADGTIFSTKDCFIDQSSLTGESFPIEKQALLDSQPSVQSATEATHAVFMGSLVMSGQLRFIVCQTGAQTLLGTLSQSLDEKPLSSAFLQSTQTFGLFLMRLTILLVFLTLLINLFMHRPWLDAFLFSIALGVGMTPEFLPMIVSVTLARGAIVMAKQKVIVKRVSAVYDMGSMDVLCTDKTGTLTEAHIRLDQSLDPYGVANQRVFELIYLNSFFETGTRNPLITAILEHKDMQQTIQNWEKLDEIPFDFLRRRSSVLIDNGKERLVIVKGPVETLLKSCTRVQREGTNPVALKAADKQTVLTQFQKLSENGFMILGVAWKKIPLSQHNLTLEDEKDLVFSGFASFSDQPKAKAAQALRALVNDGIQIKIITGDNEFVTQHLCTRLSIPIQGLLTGPEIAKMNDHELQARVGQTNLFCRVTPDQKRRILYQLKNLGHVVGFMGDGINDAGALHIANVSISVNNAVPVAKEAATFILLKRDLAVIHQGILEGRRTFANIMKYAMMGTSSNLGNMISMVGASLFLPFLPMLPTQILLNNLLYDLSEIAIPFDRVDKAMLVRPVHWNMNFIRNFMLILGPLSSLFDFLVFYILLHVFHAGESLFQTGWFVESLATQILVIFIIRTHLNPLRSFPHPLLIITSLACVGMGILLTFTSLGTYLGFSALPNSFLFALTAIVIVYLGLAELLKRFFYSFLAPKVLI